MGKSGSAVKSGAGVFAIAREELLDCEVEVTEARDWLEDVGGEFDEGLFSPEPPPPQAPKNNVMASKQKIEHFIPGLDQQKY